MSKEKKFIIEGKNINSISTFYNEINRIFMNNVDWKLGNTLDGLDDMFYGGFGEIDGDEPITIIWKDFEKNKDDLGYQTTKDYYEEKLKNPNSFNVEFFKKSLKDLEEGKGQTYLDIIIEIINDHKNIKLIIK